MENPPRGFEQVVLTSFYLKRDIVMREVRSWLLPEHSDPKMADYNGLVSSHNSQLVQELRGDGYKKCLEKEIARLQHTLDQVRLRINSDPSQLSVADSSVFLAPGQQCKRYRALPDARSACREEQRIQIEPVNEKKDLEEELDLKSVAFEIASEDQVSSSAAGTTNSVRSGGAQPVAAATVRKIDLSDLSVTNRWSRYIGAMGVEAVARQAESSVLVVGACALGAEVAKNIVLGGVKRLSVFDPTLISTQADRGGQFFIDACDIGGQLTRAESTVAKLRALNPYVTCDSVPRDLSLQDLLSTEGDFALTKYNVILLLNQNLYQSVIPIARHCRTHNICVVAGEVRGLRCRVAVDFGLNFVVQERNAEPLAEAYIESIDVGSGTVHTIARHSFSGGDIVQVREAVSAELSDKKKPLNGAYFVVERVLPGGRAFQVKDGATVLSEYAQYVRNGVLRQVREPLTMNFLPLEEVLVSSSEQVAAAKFDELMHTLFGSDDAVKLQHLNELFNAYARFECEEGHTPRLWNADDLSLFASKYAQAKDNAQAFAAFRFAASGAVIFPPLAAFIGGIIA